MNKWIYERDYQSSQELYNICLHWHNQGFKVFIQGYSAIQCQQFQPRE